jgi:hypothetical protein
LEKNPQLTSHEWDSLQTDIHPFQLKAKMHLVILSPVQMQKSGFGRVERVGERKASLVERGEEGVRLRSKNFTAGN